MPPPPPPGIRTSPGQYANGLPNDHPRDEFPQLSQADAKDRVSDAFATCSVMAARWEGARSYLSTYCSSLPEGTTPRGRSPLVAVLVDLWLIPGYRIHALSSLAIPALSRKRNNDRLDIRHAIDESRITALGRPDDRLMGKE